MGRRTFKSWTSIVIAIAVAPEARSSDPAAAQIRLAFVQVAQSESRPIPGELSNTILGNRYRLGMRLVTADFEKVKSTLRVETDDFACAADPSFDHTGTRLVFAGKRRPTDPFEIWELGDRNSPPRRLTSFPSDCVEPRFLPGGDVVFVSTLASEFEEHGGRRSLSLFRWSAGDSTPTRLTFNPSSDFDPAVLPDGRIVYSSWQHVGNHFWPAGLVALMLVNDDGTGLFPLSGNHRGPWLKRGPTPFGRDGVAFVAGERSGDFAAGALMATSLNDPFAAYAPLVSVGQMHVAGAAPLPGGGLVLSGRPAEAADATFGLYVARNGSFEVLYDDPDRHELLPAVGADGTRPLGRISTVDPGQDHGMLLILNCYETDRDDQSFPQPGDVARVRVLEGRSLHAIGGKDPWFESLPERESEPLLNPTSATGHIPVRILGEVSPALDGSVFLKVPADRPLRLQLIDREGFAMVNERAWFWVRPNESRVCIGCHENRELAPHNRSPLAARRAPTDMTDPANWRTVSFRKDVRPIISATCAVSGCHSSPTPTAGLNLSAERLASDADPKLADRFGPAYANLLKRQPGKPYGVGGRLIHPGHSRASPLMWMLYGRALAPQYREAPFDRPMVAAHPGPMLPNDQIEIFRKWIDLGAPYDDMDEPEGESEGRAG